MKCLQSRVDLMVRYSEHTALGALIPRSEGTKLPSIFGMGYHLMTR